jgi:hypothetical protein
MSSEKRRIAPNAFDKDVLPLKIRVGASFFGISKSRFRVQQTQKSFSMTVLATPRAAPVSPKSAAKSEIGGDQQRRVLIEFADQVEQQLAAGLAER